MGSLLRDHTMTQLASTACSRPWWGGGDLATLQSKMLPPSEISEQIADYQADIWSNIRFQISDARCRCHNLSVDPDFRFQISDFWAKIYPRTRFLVRFQISDFTCPDQAPSHGPPTSFAGWRITRQSAICNLLSARAQCKEKAAGQIQITVCKFQMSLGRAPDLRRAHIVSRFQFPDFKAS